MKISATVKFTASKLIGGGFILAGQSLSTIQTGEEKLEISTLV